MESQYFLILFQWNMLSNSIPRNVLFHVAFFFFQDSKSYSHWGKRVLQEPSREEGVSSWGLVFLVTWVCWAMARSGRAHCQNLSGMPTEAICGGRGRPRCGEELEMSPGGPFCPCNLMLVGGSSTWPVIWVSLKLSGIYFLKPAYSACFLHLPLLLFHLPTSTVCSGLNIMKYVAGQDLAPDGAAQWELNQWGWHEQ